MSRHLKLEMHISNWEVLMITDNYLFAVNDLDHINLQLSFSTLCGSKV